MIDKEIREGEKDKREKKKEEQERQRTRQKKIFKKPEEGRKRGVRMNEIEEGRV